MKIKKIAITLVVIVAGLMVGIIFSTSLPSITKKMSNNPASLQNISKEKRLTLTLDAKPNAIKVIEEDSDLRRLPDENRSILTITYTNNTDSDLSGVQLWASGTGADFGFTDPKNATYEKDTKLGNTKYSVYKLGDIKKGQHGEILITLFARQPGFMTINMELKTKEIQSTKANSANVTAN